MSPTVQTLYQVVEGTWPPAATRQVAGCTLRDGAGGGKRVSAVTVNDPRLGPVSDAALGQVEAAQRALAQPPLFMIREGEEALDAQLGASGYEVIDPVNIYVAPVAVLAAEEMPRVATFTIWEPLEIMRDIWAQGGIGPERVAVMARATCPKTALFGRHDNRPSAAAYVGLHDGIAMVHALEVLARDRRHGIGRLMMLRAARWAQAQGAPQLAVICTTANDAANALYRAMGFRLAGHYHYRIKG